MSLFTEEVVLIGRSASPTGRDVYGNDTYSEVRISSPAWIEQGGGVENTDFAEQSVANSRVYLPLEADLEAVDRLEWDGKTWEVVGDPGRQPGGFLAEGYQVAGIQRVTG